MKNLSYTSLLIITLSMTACLSDHKENNNSAAIRGDYFGQTPPGDTAKLFAPDIISTGMNERDFAISPDGKKLYFISTVPADSSSVGNESKRVVGISFS